MIRSILAGFLFLLALSSSASAQSCTVPNTLTNGNNADATQVMGNFAAILACLAPTPQGRLTLASGTPVMSSSNSGKTMIYYTPYVGNLVPIYNGTTMVATAFTEFSVATTDTTKSPAAIGPSKVNDWFVWNDSGTIRIGHGPDWTNDTTRSAGTSLVMVNGILLNSVSITNGPAASRGTYVGTTRSNASSQLDWIFGGNGVAGSLMVWNTYNRVNVSSSASDSTSSWTYASATVRASNNGILARDTFVTGLAEDTINADYMSLVNVPQGAGFANTGFALDNTTAFDVYVQPESLTVGGLFSAITNILKAYPPQLGSHFIAALESTDGTTACGFLGTSRQAIRVSLRM